jgi:hypothetical protein
VFSFPNPVNEVSARLVAAGVVLMCVATLALDQPWIIVVLAYGFVSRVLTGPTLSPLGQLVTRALTPALPFEEKPTPGPPKRFAQGIGATLSVAALISWAVFDNTTVAYVLVAMILVAASLEAFLGLCLGCRMFALLIRARVVPEHVCEECNDLWARLPQSGTRA